MIGMIPSLKEIRFTIAGCPHAKERSRHATLPNGRMYDYTPAKTVKYERLVRSMCAKAVEKYGKMPDDVPVRVEAWFYIEMPRSWSKHKRAEYNGRYHISKPDGDNLLKSILDGCNTIAFKDDCCVAESFSHKYWSDCPRTEVHISMCD